MKLGQRPGLFICLIGVRQAQGRLAWLRQRPALWRRIHPAKRQDRDFRRASSPRNGNRDSRARSERDMTDMGPIAGGAASSTDKARATFSP